MKVVINPFDTKSISKAQRTLRQYKKDFEKKLEEFTRRLAEIGVTVAGGIYSVVDYDGEHDVSVYLEKTDSGYTVIAAGRTVGFLEFGTGINNPEWVDNNNVSNKPYTPPPHGSYGDGHGKQPYGWWFKSQDYGVVMHTYGHPPAEAMLTARNEMVANVARIAREVWR